MKLFSWFATWDSGILAALALLLAYTVLIGRHKSLAVLVSIYVGYLMASTWGDKVTGFFTGDRVLFNQLWLKASTTPFLVQTVLMIVVTLLLSTFIKIGGKRGRYSLPEVVLYAVFTLGLILMFTLSFMTPPQHELVLTSSRILPFIDKWRDWIMVAPVFMIIFFGITANEE